MPTRNGWLPPRSLTFDQLAVVLVFIAFAAVACLATTQSDTYWHLRAGQDFLESGEVPLVDTYSHTAAGLPWPNHSWLWQVGAISLYRVGGLPLLTLVNAALATAALAASFRLTTGDSRRSCALLLFSVPVIATSVAVRPQVTSALLFVVLLWLVSRERYLWIPGLFLLWANLHAAVATGGLVLVSSTLFAASLWFRHRTEMNARRVRHLGVVTLLSALATFVNPLGPGLWTYVATSIPRSRRNEISEWATSLHFGVPEVITWMWIAGLFVLVVARWRHLRSWSEQSLVVVALVMALPALIAVRNVAMFVLAALPACIALSRNGQRTAEASDDRSSMHVVLALSFAAAAIVLVVGLWSAPASRLGWRPVSPEIAAAVRSCPGPLYNHYNQGGFLIWAVPEVPVFLDSRQDPYPQELLEAQREVEATGRYVDVFDTYGIQCAALPPTSPTVDALLSDGWVAVVRESDWVVLHP